VTALRRLSCPGLQFFRGVEVQDGKRRSDGGGRGALHFHVLIRSSVPLDELQVQDLALSAGFGCVLDLQEVRSVQQAAAYASKYVSKSADEREDVPWTVEFLDEDTGELEQVHTFATYRAWSASKDWGVTIRELKAVAAEQARKRAEALRAAWAGVPELEELGDVPGGCLAPPGAAEEVCHGAV
jgi:hypothetical protein